MSGHGSKVKECDGATKVLFIFKIMESLKIYKISTMKGY